MNDSSKTIDCLELVPDFDEVTPVTITTTDEQTTMDCDYQRKHDPNNCQRLGGHCLLYVTGQYLNK